jgi:hypothetical protein
LSGTSSPADSVQGWERIQVMDGGLCHGIRAGKILQNDEEKRMPLKISTLQRKKRANLHFLVEIPYSFSFYSFIPTLSTFDTTY